MYLIEYNRLNEKTSASAAFGLSLIMPGLGQIYNGSAGIGAVLMVGGLGGVLYGYVSTNMANTTKDAKQADSYRQTAGISLIAGGVIWLISALAAPAEAAARNHTIDEKRERLIEQYLDVNEFDTGAGTIRIDPGVTRNGMGVNLCFKF